MHSMTPWYQRFLKLALDHDVLPLDDVTASGAQRSDSISLDSDATQTQVLFRQLEHIKDRIYDVKYTELLALEFIPLAEDTPEDVETITYRMWDIHGSAEVISNYADDVPSVDAHVTEFPTPVFSTGASYNISILDLKRAARGQVNLDARKALGARHMIDRKTDHVLAFGIPDAGTEGFTNNSNVPVVALNNGNWLGGVTTPAEMLADMFQLEQSVISTTRDIHRPNTLILPIDHYGVVSTTPLFPGSGPMTVLEFFLKNAQSITSVHKWYAFDDVGGEPRAIAYWKSDEALEAEVPMLVEELPPQPVNLAFKILMWARVAGVIWYYPFSAAYGEGL